MQLIYRNKEIAVYQISVYFILILFVSFIAFIDVHVNIIRNILTCLWSLFHDVHYTNVCCL